jgi:RimJ/RimL family protein N-acetyltransferase
MLEGELVRLRAREPDDLERNLRWINDPEVRLLLLGSRYPISRGAEEKWMEANQSSSFEHVRLAIETKEGQHIGNLDLRQASPEHRAANLGIMIGERDYWGRGYGTDALRTLLRLAFGDMNLNRVWLMTGENNSRAQACYRRCGFREEGRLRQDRYLDGRYVDTIIMGVLREEFEVVEEGGS